jgi:hypothetical protein
MHWNSRHRLAAFGGSLNFSKTPVCLRLTWMLFLIAERSFDTRRRLGLRRFHDCRFRGHSYARLSALAPATSLLAGDQGGHKQVA